MKMAKPKKKKQPANDPGDQSKTVSENRRARHRFEVLEQIECGLVLVGSEVKSLRDGKVSLDEAYGRIREGELWLMGCDIPEYKQATHWNHEPKRPRKMLVNRGQLKKLTTRAFEKGQTLVPLRLYFNARGIAKVNLAVCKGKKLVDKRESLKRADVDRRIERSMRR